MLKGGAKFLLIFLQQFGSIALRPQMEDERPYDGLYIYSSSCCPSACPSSVFHAAFSLRHLLRINSRPGEKLILKVFNVLYQLGPPLHKSYHIGTVFQL